MKGERDFEAKEKDGVVFLVESKWGDPKRLEIL